MTTRQAACAYSSRRHLQQRIVTAIILTAMVRQIQASIWNGSGMNLPNQEGSVCKIFGDGCSLPTGKNTDSQNAKGLNTEIDITAVIFGGGCGCADNENTIGAEPLTR